MVRSKWNVEEIEDTRLQMNQLQQRMEQYASTKKLGIAFLRAFLGGIKARILRSRHTNEEVSSVDFFASNPDFKPYQIKLKSPVSSETLPKILHVIPYFVTGGSQQLVVDLIEGLSDQYAHEVALFKVHAEQGYVGITVHDCSVVNTPEAFLSILQSIRPDIIHVHYYGRWPTSFWHWYHAVFQGSFLYGKAVIENCNIPYMPYFHSNIRKYVYVSQYAQDTYGIRKLDNQVIYPGSNFSFFQRLGTRPDPDTIGMVYRLENDKLNENAIQPFILSVQKRPQTKVIIVGGGRYLELFKQRVSEAGVASQFTFTGYVAYERLAEYYRQLAVFVAPIYSESFGQVTPFAMNMGIAVAAYNIGALEEMLNNQEVLAPGDDADALSDIIVGLLNDPARRESIGAANRARAASLFTVEAMVQQYQVLYQSLL